MKLLKLLTFLSFPILIWGQSTNIGTPFIQNFYKKETHAGLQTWEIDQDQNGVVYFANNQGLISYDGTNWRVFRLPKKTICRSLKIAKSGEIYIGGQNEIGYFAPNEKGILIYHSLLEKIPEEHRTFDDVWDIVLKDDLLLFRTNRRITIFSQKNFQQVIEIDASFLGEMGGEVYLADYNNGLKRWQNDSFELVENGAVFNQKVVGDILQRPTGQMILITLENGLFISEGDSFIPFSSKNNAFFATSKLDDAALLPNGKIAIGTQRSGVIILNEKGAPLWHLTKKKGLQNSNVRSIFKDQSNNLWLGLDNGIDYVKTNSPFQIFYPDGELEGTAYHAIQHQGKIYFGTSNGLYFKDWKTYYNPFQGDDYQLVQGTEGQVWGLSQVKDDLFLGHNDGAFKIENDRAISLDNNEGAWIFEEVEGTNEMIGGTYAGLQLFEKKNDWSFNKKLEGLTESSRIFVSSEQGDFWMAHPYRGVYKIQYNKELKKVEKVEFFGKQKGLPEDSDNHVFSIFRRIVVAGKQGLFYYDETQNKFLPDEQLNELFGADTQVLRLFESSHDDVWFVTEKEVGYLDVTDFGLDKKVEKMILADLKENLVGGFEFIYPLNEDNIFIGLEKGFIHFSHQMNSEIYRPTPPIFSRVSRLNGEETLLFAGNKGAENSDSRMAIPELAYDQNAIRFNFSAPNFEQQNLVEYSYFLEDFDHNWSDPSPKTEKEYTNLTPKTYHFRVKARIKGGEWSEERSFAFEVSPPWYATKSAMAIYGFGILGVLGSLILIPKRLHDKETKQLIVEHQQVVEETEQQIDHLKNEKLQAEIEYQNQTLASTTMHLLQKSEMLNKLKSDLKKISKKVDSSENRKEIDRLVRLIDRDANLDEDWNQFSLFFDKVHSDFIKKLREKYPVLTPKDQKMCAYLRMSLSTKEIASLLNISVRGVEISRYRLRKKMEIPQGENLIEFLMEV